MHSIKGTIVLERRLFLKSTLAGLSSIFVGQNFGLNTSFANHHVQSLSFRITDAVKEMVTHNEINKALCYFWIFKEERFPADCPGPIIYTTEGELIEVTVSNDLDENHAFFIEGVVDTGPIPPGGTVTVSFEAPSAGTYIYYDNLNSPVNRVMGLHGALIVMPAKAFPGNKTTPYSIPTAEVQKLFNDLGTDALFPGLSWEEGDASTGTPAFRQHVWLLHEASPILFEEVGNYPPGEDYPADKFLTAFTKDPYANTFETGRFNRKPHFFTINGQSGHFSHHNPFISPYRRVGEPVLVRVLNPGIFDHSLHLHGNHFFVLSNDKKISNNIEWVDTRHIYEMQTMDILIPMRRPPDVPNTRGIGAVDPPLMSLRGKPVWPPVEEFNFFFPEEGERFAQRQSPLCYTMHDHVEPTLTAQGGNYPLGLMSGLTIIGDRTVPGFMNFPNYPDEVDGINLEVTGQAAPSIPNHRD